MKLAKSKHKKTFTGTLGGLSDATGLDYGWTRVLFILVCLLTKGWCAVAYPILLIIMPSASAKSASYARVVRGNTTFYTKRMLREVRDISLYTSFGRVIGIVLLGLGLGWLTNPIRPLSAVLLVGGTILLFDPFSLRKSAPTLATHEQEDLLPRFSYATLGQARWRAADIYGFTPSLATKDIRPN
jgi:phage shock protein PspC (stress-responsive transcriptional regulator)